ncbi:MAG: site-specific DNA-methyltransferase [Chitinispirillales bacterium]|jgi:adenine-specific DNA-methyltransferase|nr:site-specific DNA-methyltransferase [Chitinispirillales bacterium]
MDGQSLNIKQTDTARLRELFPGLFSEDKIDPEKFKAAFGDDIDAAPPNERYTLNWAGKADAYRVLQERTATTLRPQPELSVNFDTAENVFIEGENLEVLKILQKSYYNKIKCIIIDPPYNTGNDSFIYPDRFKENLEEYERRVGERDEGGYLMKEGLFRKNSKENGHYHSNWLSMMLPRLFLARNLMRDDGVIFVHIDDNEVHNLRMVMNEVFGEENFRNCIAVKRGTKSVQAQFDSIDKLGIAYEYILLYSKKSDIRLNHFYFDLEETKEGTWNNHWRGTDRPTMRYELFGITPENGQWRWSKKRSLLAISNYERMLKELQSVDPTQDDIDKWYFSQEEDIDLLRLSRNGKPEHYIAPTNQKFGNNLWTDLQLNGTSELKRLDLDTFENPKNPILITRMIKWMTNGNDIVLDFFAGSATAAQAVLELNQEDNGTRKFILVQLPELCKESGKAYKSGYKTIADISRERIRRVIRNLNNSTDNIDLGFKSYKLSPSNFKVWRSEDITEENIERQLEAFIDPVKPESQVEDMLVELILKSGYKLTEKVENRGDFYYINNELVVALTKMNQEIAAKIMELSPKPQKVIVLDRLFEGSDELKTNTALQMKDAGVELRTV